LPSCSKVAFVAAVVLAVDTPSIDDETSLALAAMVPENVVILGTGRHGMSQDKLTRTLRVVGSGMGCSRRGRLGGGNGVKRLGRRAVGDGASSHCVFLVLLRRFEQTIVL